MTELDILKSGGVWALIVILSLQLGLKAVGVARARIAKHNREVVTEAPRTDERPPPILSDLCMKHEVSISENRLMITNIKDDLADIKQDVKEIKGVLIDSHTGTKIPRGGK